MLLSAGTSGPVETVPFESRVASANPSAVAYPRTNSLGRRFRNSGHHGELAPASWNIGSPSAPSSPTGNTARPSGSGQLAWIEGGRAFRRAHWSALPAGLAGGSWA